MPAWPQCAAALLAALLALPGEIVAVRVGDRAPEFQAPGRTGGMLKLSDFRGKQMVLIGSTMPIGAQRELPT